MSAAVAALKLGCVALAWALIVMSGCRLLSPDLPGEAGREDLQNLVVGLAVATLFFLM